MKSTYVMTFDGPNGAVVIIVVAMTRTDLPSYIKDQQIQGNHLISLHIGE